MRTMSPVIKHIRVHNTKFMNTRTYHSKNKNYDHMQVYKQIPFIC